MQRLSMRVQWRHKATNKRETKGQRMEAWVNESERFEDGMLTALKAEEVGAGQGIEVASSS